MTRADIKAELRRSACEDAQIRLQPETIAELESRLHKARTELAKLNASGWGAV